MTKYETFAQDETDVFILGQFPSDFRGRYLDCGSHSPVDGSNTYLLYRRGWRGVVVEPDPDLLYEHGEIRPEDRRFLGVASDVDGEIDLFECEDSTVSTIVSEEADARGGGGLGIRPRRVMSYRVDSLVSGHQIGPVDVLSIDVEGAERAVLSSCPFGPHWLPRILAIEACLPCTDIPCHGRWEDLILPHGYRHVGTCGVNRIYRVG